MTEEAQKQLVVVLGMHRSGTSALTRGLVALGIELGDHLMSALPENPKGYWEDLDIQGLNVDLLFCLGHDWHTLDLISGADLASERALAFRLSAIELLRQKTADTNIYGIKDPRIARLLPFWQSVFDHLGLEVGYVIAVRNPLSVARSMKWLKPEKSYYLWLEHMVPAVLGTASARRVFIDYDLLMDNPATQLRRIATGLGLSTDQIQDSLVREYRETFLEDGLRHSRYSLEALKLDPTVPRPVCDAFEALTKLASEELRPNSAEAIQTFCRLEQELNDLRPAFSYMEHLNKALAEREGRIGTLSQALAECEGRIGTLSQALAECEGRIGTLSQALAEREGQIGTLSQVVRELQQQLAAVYTSTCWRVTAPLRFIGHQCLRLRFVRNWMPAISGRLSQPKGGTSG